jgi:hypothetical protein
VVWNLVFTDFLHVFIEKCESRITMHVKIKILYRKWSLITTVIPSERREHPPAFTCGSPDFKYYAASQEQLSCSGNTTLLSSIYLHCLKCI